MAEGDSSVSAALRRILIVDHYFSLQPGEARERYMAFLWTQQDLPGYREAREEIKAINKRNRDARSR